MTVTNAITFTVAKTTPRPIARVDTQVKPTSVQVDIQLASTSTSR